METGRTRTLAHWNEICDISLEYLDSVIFRLPRLGSSVRIASPAPNSPHRKAAELRGFRVFALECGAEDRRSAYGSPANLSTRRRAVIRNRHGAEEGT